MFYLRREREERAKGRSERAALEAAAATSGRSVLISGLTVMVAMAGMFVTGNKAFASFGVATMMVVAVAMLGSLTVLPALLSRLGDRVDKVRVRRRRNNGGESRMWGWIVDRVLRRPALSAAIAGGALLLLALPAIQMRMADASPDTFPAKLEVVKTYKRMQQAFPGTALPANVIVEGAERERPGGPRGDLPARAAGARERPRARADHDRRQQGRHGREHHAPDRRQRLGQGVERARWRSCATRSSRRPSARSRTRRPASPG